MKHGVTLYFGKSWTGKTARMIYELRDESRVILVDPKCSQLVKLRGWQHLWPEIDPETELWTDDTLSREFAKVVHSPFKIVVHLRYCHREGLELLCRLVEAMKDCVLAVDELGLFVPPGSAGALPRNITGVVVSGTHKGVRIVGTAQRPSLVHKTLRSNASRMLFFRVIEKYDIDVVEGYLSKDFDVSKLPDHVCIEWQDGRDAFVDATLAGKLGKVLPGARS